MLQNKLKMIVDVDEDILNGTPVFKGTRVSIPLIFEYLSKGWSLDDLKSAYPSVKTEDISYLLKVYSEELSGWNGKKVKSKTK